MQFQKISTLLPHRRDWNFQGRGGPLLPQNVKKCMKLNNLEVPVGVRVLSPGQTITTCQLNISQHCWAQHVACVWPPCCDVLGVVGPNLTIFTLEPTTPNMLQHIATGWPNEHNMLRPTMLRYVALTCCDHLAGALKKVKI